MNEQLKVYLEKLAATKTWREENKCRCYDRETIDMCDAHDDGVADGRILLAREILEQFKEVV